jgi:hypothetical protein
MYIESERTCWRAARVTLLVFALVALAAYIMGGLDPILSVAR